MNGRTSTEICGGVVTVDFNPPIQGSVDFTASALVKIARRVPGRHLGLPNSLGSGALQELWSTRRPNPRRHQRIKTTEQTSTATTLLSTTTTLRTGRSSTRAQARCTLPVERLGHWWSTAVCLSLSISDPDVSLLHS